MGRSALALVGWFTFGALSGASERALAEDWTVDDLATAAEDSDWALAPDGSAAAWVRSEVVEVDGSEQRVSHLRLWRGARAASSQGSERDAESVRLTRGVETIVWPRFAPDGRHLAYLSDRASNDLSGGGGGGETDASVQLWVVPLGGGEPFVVTRFDRHVLDYGWIDPETFVVAAQESPGELERQRDERGDDAFALDDPAEAPPVRLFRVTFGSDGEESVRRLTTDRQWLDSLAVSPDGRRAVVLAAQSLSYSFDQRTPPHTLLVDLETGGVESILADGKLVPQGVRWALDSKSFYFVNARSSHPLYRMATVLDLWMFELSSGKTTAVDLGWDRGLRAPVEPLADGFLALLADGTRIKAVRYQRDPAARPAGGRAWVRRDLAGIVGGEIDDWTVSGDGKTVLYRASTSVRPPAGWVAKIEGARLVRALEIAERPSVWDGKSAGKSELVRWKGARGETVEGILLYPLDLPLDPPLDPKAQGERRPLILAIHGGPTDVDTDTWRTDWSTPDVLWRSRGAYVLRVNYHGSGGYGLEWAESIAGRYYELEIPDLETGVDALIARGLVDPARLGCSGWSNGGILCAELITRTQRYKAASIGAADVEWISDWANVDFGAAFDNYYFGGPPWERIEHYVAKSPFFRLTAVTTPTLVFTGTADTNVPPHQSRSLFRALQQIGKAPTRLVTFPDATHGLDAVEHIRRKMAEELDWFDRYLFGRDPSSPSSSTVIPSGSPLESLVVAARAARVGVAFGESREARLLPEVVRFGDLEVARFEITRAQFAAFDPADPAAQFAAGEENLPAIVPFERARAYAAWLAQRLGRPFRLPTETEARELSDLAASVTAAARDGGNTLDHWLGYTANPEDLAVVQEKLAALPAGALLSVVGRFAAASPSGSAKEAVFDLDGNAAEWALRDDSKKGSAIAIGPSADLPVDPRSVATPALEYTGFRVVAVPPTPTTTPTTPPTSAPAPPR